MSVVVSDTGPIQYLNLVSAAEFLPNLFGEVIIPPAVLNELKNQNTPAIVKEFVNNLPLWVKVIKPHNLISNTMLGAGKTEAISLAKELNATLLVDDFEARNYAKSQHLQITGTIGILEKMATKKFINLEEAFKKLSSTNAFIDPALLQKILLLHKQKISSS